MPYRTYVDPTEQYHNSAFDPLTGRLNGAQLVMQWMARQKQEKEEADRIAWEKIARSLEQESAELGIKGKKLGIEQAEWEKAHRVDPKQKLMYENWIGNMEAKAKEQSDLRKIEAQKKAEIEIAKVKGTVGGGAEKNPVQWMDASVKRQKDIDDVLTSIDDEISSLEKLNTADSSNIYIAPPTDRPGMKSTISTRQSDIAKLKRRKNTLLSLKRQLLPNKPISPELDTKIEQALTGEQKKEGGGDLLTGIANLAGKLLGGMAPAEKPGTAKPTKKITLSGVVKEADLPPGTDVYQHPEGFEMVSVNGKWLRLVK